MTPHPSQYYDEIVGCACIDRNPQARVGTFRSFQMFAGPTILQALNLVNNTALSAPFDRMATWGGSVVRDPRTGLYHIFAAGFVGPNGSLCGLSSWESNSLVLTGSSPSPAGPFSATGHLSVAVGTFAHNPEVVYSPKERKFLLFILGYANASTAYACDDSGSPTGHYAGGRIPPWLGTVSLHTADSPNGPWSSGVILAHGTNANPTAWVDAASGEISLVYGRFDKPHRPHKRYYSVLSAKSSHGPWRSLGDLPATLNPPSQCSPPSEPSSPWAKCWCNNEVTASPARALKSVLAALLKIPCPVVCFPMHCNVARWSSGPVFV